MHNGLRFHGEAGLQRASLNEDGYSVIETTVALAMLVFIASILVLSLEPLLQPSTHRTGALDLARLQAERVATTMPECQPPDCNHNFKTVVTESFGQTAATVDVQSVEDGRTLVSFRLYTLPAEDYHE